MVMVDMPGIQQTGIPKKKETDLSKEYSPQLIYIFSSSSWIMCTTNPADMT